MWVRENLADVESDMSAFHRVDDFTRMPARTFFSRAVRLVGYNGIIRRRAQAEADRKVAESTSVTGGSYSPTPDNRTTAVSDSVFIANQQADGWAERVAS